MQQNKYRKNFQETKTKHEHLEQKVNIWDSGQIRKFFLFWTSPVVSKFDVIVNSSVTQQK